MIAETSAELPLCPFTGKPGWISKKAARQALKASAARVGWIGLRRVYRCQCGLVHLTSHRRS